MMISGPTSAAIATKVWSQTTRSLTNLSPLAAQAALPNQSLALSSTVNTAPIAGFMRLAQISGKAGAAGSLLLIQSDNTNDYTCVTIASGQSGAFYYGGISSTFPAKIKNNDAANAALWALNGLDYTL